jgi:tetratricopeptide (TPR) repeat protein
MEPADVRAALERVLGSQAFARPHRLRLLLAHLVQRTLEGRQDSLKEIVLGMEIFARGPDFDPKSDPIVRMDARRLRARLTRYYATEGAGDQLTIILEPGSYVPQFRPRDDGAHRDPAAPERLVPEPQNSFGVFRLLVRGWHHLSEANQRALLLSKQCFEAVLEREPEYAPAWAGLAAARSLLVMYGAECASGGWPQAEHAARKAVALDDALPEAHTALGMIAALRDFRPAIAETHFRAALALDAYNVNARLCLAMMALSPLGRLDEAERELHDILQGERLNPKALQCLALILYLKRRFELAVEVANSSLDVQPDNGVAYFVLGNAYDRLGLKQEALKAFRKLDALLPGVGLLRCSRAFAKLYSGHTTVIKAALRVAEWMERSVLLPSAMLADLFVRLGDHERGVQWLERAFAQRAYRALYLAVDPAFDEIRDDTRCIRLLNNLRSVDRLAQAQRREVEH